MQRRSSRAPATDDAYLAITTIGGWVANAETKVGLLAAAITVLASAVAGQLDVLTGLLKSDVGLRTWAALCAFSLSSLALVACAGFLFAAVRPRLGPGDEPSRFSFPNLADADLDALADPESVATARKEAWLQARTLARIARAKYLWFARALVAAIVAGLAFVAWSALAP